MEDKKTEWPEKTKGFVDFHENIFYIYGPPKIGKTTLAAQFPDALFLLTEEGAKHQSISAWHIRSWNEYLIRLNTIELGIKDGNFPYKTIIIDTVDNLADMCDQFICNRNSVNVLAEVEYGKATSAYRKEFKKQVDRLTKLGGTGLVFISHAGEKEVSINSVVNPYAPMIGDMETGKVKMIVPTLEKRAYEYLSGLADLILYLDIDKENHRVIYSKPTKSFEAGDRTGRIPDVIPLSYQFFLDCYYGGQTALIERIQKAEEWLSQNKVDNFDTIVRVKNSRVKHLGDEKLEKSTTPQLQEYLQHLKIKAKLHLTKEKENGKIPTSK